MYTYNMSKSRDNGEYIKFKKDKCNRCGCGEDIYIRDKDGFIIRKKKEWQLYKLTVHHIDHDRYNNNPSNLETLCRLCHNEEHEFDYFFEEDYLKSKR